VLSSHSAKLDKDKKGFTRLHPSVQCLILNTSSPTREIAPKTPSSFCTQCFKSRTSSDAKLCFTNSMRKDFNCHVNTNNDVITNIYNGQFLRKYVDVPSNFSAFAFPKQQPTTRDKASKMIAMKLKVTHGKGLNNADIKSALKQSIILPNNIEDLHFYIIHLITASKVFFTKFSIIASRLLDIHHHIEKYRHIYNAHQGADKFFSAKFIFKVDSRIYAWLINCSDCKEREIVNDSLILFHSILTSFITNDFTQDLPSSIFKIKNKRVLSLNNAIESNSPPPQRNINKAKNNKTTLSEMMAQFKTSSSTIIFMTPN
jgi:hypothetical protein